jgi:MEMO1 family protein
MENIMRCIGLIIILSIFFCDSYTQTIRPIRDDVGYCWKYKEMQRFIHYLDNSLEMDSCNNALVGGISPHDDYLYAGHVYYPLYEGLKTKEAIIFGVTHASVRKEIGDPKNVIILDNFKEWLGLDRHVQISPLREFIKSKLDSCYFIVSNKAHELEHSVEAQIPFLCYDNPEIKITPIMVTSMSFERMDSLAERLSQIIVAYITQNKLSLGKDIIFLISSDANHYGNDFNNTPFGEDEAAHEKGKKEDVEIGKNFLVGDISTEKIYKFTDVAKNIFWCGKFSIPFGLLTMKKTIKQMTQAEVEGKNLKYSDSYSEGVIPIKETGMGTTAPFSLKHWVGYLSVGYYLR